MKIAILVVLGLLNLIAIYLAYENRASEKIVSAFAGITFGALSAVFFAVFVFSEQTPVVSKFPVCFFVNIETGLPDELRTIRFPTISVMDGGAVSLAKADHPAAFQSKAVTTTYHQLLQRLLIDWMSQKYSFTWQVAQTSYDLPFTVITTTPAAEEIPEGNVYDKDTILRSFGTDSLAGAVKDLAIGSGRKIVVPPGTSILVIPPHMDRRTGQVGEISLTNRYCTITIRTRTVGAVGGIGEYAVLGGFDSLLADKFQTLTYEVTYSVQFTKWLSGHPELPHCKAWSETMLAMLQGDLDEQVILRKTREARLHPKVPFGGRLNSPRFTSDKTNAQE